MDKILRGALVGAVATLPMSLMMWLLERNIEKKDDVRDLPPNRIAEEVVEAAGLDGQLDREDQDRLSLAAHFAYGAACGAVYSATVARRTGLPLAVEGAVFALGVWGVSYLGWLPAANLYPSATDDSPQRNTTMIGSHVVWGTAMGVLEGVGRSEG